MGIFNSEKIFAVAIENLKPVIDMVVDKFRLEEFEVSAEENITGSWLVSITKGNLFQSVLGLKTALNLEVSPGENGVTAKAGVGIFGMQAVPSAVMLFVAWPVLLTQIWGLVQQSKLDDKALMYVEEGLNTYASGIFGAGSVQEDAESSTGVITGEKCSSCGAQLTDIAKFCPKCGQPVQHVMQAKKP